MQGRIKLTDDIEICAPFDLIFCGRRETITSPGHIEMKQLPPTPPLLDFKSMRLFIGGRLTDQGNITGSDEFCRLTKTESGKIELWLDPRYVGSVLI